MKANDIDLSTMLDFRPDQGRLLLNDNRMLLFSQSALGRLDELLVQHLGSDFARAVFSQFGYRCGVDDYQVIGEGQQWASDMDRITSGPIMHTWEGIVHVEPTELHFDHDAGEFFMSGIWRNSFEAENHLRQFGLSATPVCASLTGYASGWSSAFFNSSLLAIETACIAQGDETCAFEIRPSADWDERADPWRIALDATSDSISSALEKRVAERTRALEAVNRDLEESRFAAESANRAKSQFLANISHELRTPMNGVLGVAELLKATPLDARQRELLELIVESGNRQVEIITDLLDYSQLESGDDAVRVAPFTLTSTLNKVVSRYQAAARSSGVELSCNIDGPASEVFMSDADKVERVVTSLVNNAVKFAPPGGQVQITAKVEDEEIVVTVDDTGIGVPAELADAIFAPFVQVDSSSTREHGGTGLGLSIARGVAGLLGGTLRLIDRETQGATFEFRLPAQPAPRGDAGTGIPAQARVARVLVAEDNLVNSRVITALLESLGCEVTAVHNGAEAVDRAGDLFDLILLDLHMPQLDGIQAAVEIKGLQQPRERVPFLVAVTADARVEIKRACIDAGFDAFVTKPVTRAQLAAVVEQANSAITEHRPTEDA